MDPVLVLRAILFRLRQGCSWGCLDIFGNWETIYGHWRRWVDSGIWDKVLTKLASKAGGKLWSIDSTSCKVHKHGHGGVQGLRLSALARVVADPTQRFMLWSTERGEWSMCFSVRGIATILSLESIFATLLQMGSQSLPTRPTIRMTSGHFSMTLASDAAFRRKRIGSILSHLTNRNTRNATGLKMPSSVSRNSGQSLRGMKNLLRRFLAL